MNIPTKNLNPGDLKDPATGTFRTFKTPQEGFDALKNDLNIKISGKSKTGVTPDSDLTHFSSIYAPASDKNDPVSYANNLSKKLGVPVNTPIKNLANRVDDFANAISENEGYQGPRVLGATQSAAPAQTESQPTSPAYSMQQFGQLVQKKYPQYAHLDADTVAKKVLEKYPQYKSSIGDQSSAPQQSGPVTSFDLGASSNTSTPQTDNKPEEKVGLLQKIVRGVASPYLKGASSVAGLYDAATGNQKGADKITNEGIDYGYFGKAKPIGAGFDISKKDGTLLGKGNASALADSAKVGSRVASDILTVQSAAGLAKNLFGSGSALKPASSIVKDITGLSPEKLASSGAEGQINALNEALSKTKLASDRLILEKAIEEVAPRVLTEGGIGSAAQLHPLANAIPRAIGSAGKFLGKNLLGIGNLGLTGGLIYSLLKKNQEGSK